MIRAAGSLLSIGRNEIADKVIEPKAHPETDTCVMCDTSVTRLGLKKASPKRRPEKSAKKGLPKKSAKKVCGFFARSPD